MRTVKRVKVPIRLCEVCAWAMVTRCVSCGVQHCSEAVIRESFYQGRSARRRRKPGSSEDNFAPSAPPENGGLTSLIYQREEQSADDMGDSIHEVDRCCTSSHGSGFESEDTGSRVRVDAAIAELPAYLEETSARLFELENSLSDVSTARLHVSALKERHKKLQEHLAESIRSSRAG